MATFAPIDYTGSNGVDDSYSDIDLSNEPSAYELYLAKQGEKSQDLERAAELKRKEIHRKGELLYEADGTTLIDDSNAMIRAKEIANAGIRGTDWLLEASENLVDFGQGDWIGHYDQIQAENQGKRYSMDNKDFIAARDLGPNATEQLIAQYKGATHDPNSDKGIYTLKKFDGYNADGSEKFIYKYGLAEVGADARYRDQWVQDGFEIVEEKRFAGAEDWEKTWNASQDVLDARVLDSSIDLVKNEAGEMVTRDEASGINFGAGKTELLNRDLLGVDVGKTQEDYDHNRAYSEQLSAQNDAKWQNGVYSNPYRAALSGLVKVGVGTADFALDVLTPGGDNELLNDYNTAEWADKTAGYDRTQSTQALSDAATYWDQGDYLSAITNVLSDPNTMAESLPMMLGMTIGSGKFTAGSKLLSAIGKAEKAGKGAKEIALLTAKAKQTMTAKQWTMYNKYKKAPAQLKVFDHFAKNAGFHTVVGSMTNDVINDRIANKLKNKEPGTVSTLEALGVYAVQLPLLAIDRLSFSAITGIGSGGKKALKEAFKLADANGKQTIAQRVAAKAAEVTLASGAEAGQEYIQTWGEILGANAGVGGKGVSDVLGDKEKQREALMGGLGGLGAGAQMSALGSVPGVVKGGYDRYTEEETDKALRKVKTVADYGNEKIFPQTVENDIALNLSGVSGSHEKTTPIQDFIDDPIGSFTKAVDESIKKRIKMDEDQTTGFDSGSEDMRRAVEHSIVRQAISNVRAYAFKTKDNKPYIQLISTLRALDKDPNSLFKFKDMETETTGSIMDKFVDVMNKDYSNENLNDKSEATAEAARNADVDKLIEELESIQANYEVFSQGSGIDFGDDKPVEVDDTLFDNGEDALTLDKLKELLIDYRANGKDIEKVADEFEKYGFIQERRVNQNGKKQRTVQIKPSLDRYTRHLVKAFTSDNGINNMLNSKVSGSGGPTLSGFGEFVSSREKKLEAFVSKKTNKPARIGARLLVQTAKETNDMKKLVSRLKSIIKTRKSGEGQTLGEKEAKSYIEYLNELENSIARTEEKTQREQKKLQKMYSDYLGFEIDITNDDHRKIVSGMFSTRDNFEGNEEDGLPELQVPKNLTVEEWLSIKRENLQNLLKAGSKGLKDLGEPGSLDKKSFTQTEYGGFGKKSADGSKQKTTKKKAEKTTKSTQEAKPKSATKKKQDIEITKAGRVVNSKLSKMNTSLKGFTRALKKKNLPQSEIDLLNKAINDIAKDIAKTEQLRNKLIKMYKQTGDIGSKQMKVIDAIIKKGNKYTQKDSSLDDYADTKEVILDYKEGVPTENKLDTGSEKESEAVPADIDAILDRINTMSVDSGSQFTRNINDVIIEIRDTFKYVKNLSEVDRAKLSAGTLKAIENIEKSIEKDASNIENLYTVYKSTKSEAKKLGLLGKMKETFKTIAVKIKRFLGYAQKTIVDKNLKEKVVSDLNTISELIFDGNENIVNKIDQMIAMNKSLIDFSERMKAEVKDGKLQIDSKSKKSNVQYEKLKYKEYYENIVSEYKKFKAGSREKIYTDKPRKTSDRMQEVWDWINDADKNQDRYANMNNSEKFAQASKDMKQEENAENGVVEDNEILSEEDFNELNRVSEPETNDDLPPIDMYEEEGYIGIADDEFIDDDQQVVAEGFEYEVDHKASEVKKPMTLDEAKAIEEKPSSGFPSLDDIIGECK